LNTLNRVCFPNDPYILNDKYKIELKKPLLKLTDENLKKRFQNEANFTDNLEYNEVRRRDRLI